MGVLAALQIYKLHSGTSCSYRRWCHNSWWGEESELWLLIDCSLDRWPSRPAKSTRSAVCWCSAPTLVPLI